MFGESEGLRRGCQRFLYYGSAITQPEETIPSIVIVRLQPKHLFQTMDLLRAIVYQMSHQGPCGDIV